MDEFRQAQSELNGPGVRGWWTVVLEDLSDDKRDSLLAAASSPDITHRAISVVLNRWGYDVRPVQVGHWRRTHVGRYADTGRA